MHPSGSRLLEAVLAIKSAEFAVRMRAFLVLVAVLLLSRTPLKSQHLPPIEELSIHVPGKLASSLREVVSAGRMPAEQQRRIALECRVSIMNGLIEVEIRLEPGASWDESFFRSAYRVQTIHAGIDDYQGRNIPFVWARVPIENLERLV